MNKLNGILLGLSSAILLSACGGDDNTSATPPAVVPAITNYVSFLEYCKQTETLDSTNSLKITVTAIQRNVDANDCASADEKLSKKTALDLSDIPGASYISDLRPMAKLLSIKTLVIDDAQISDLTPLSGLISLEFLSLAKNHISEVSALKNFSKLRDLDLDSNQIEDILPLSNIKSLKILRIRGNSIKDISILNRTNFPNLTYLYIGGTDETLDTIRKQLPDATVY